MTSGGHHLELMELLDRLPTAAVVRKEQRLFVNERTATLTGYPREELRSLDTWMQALHGEEAEQARLIYETDRNHGFPNIRIISIRRSDREER